jgi:glutathione S-transferase
MPVLLPILYSFRRCPYAIRARMAIHYAGIQVELREVELKNKPATMLAVSSKGTVPVLLDTDGTVIEESLEVIYWALEQNDPEGWINPATLPKAKTLIDKNDNEFKGWLDKYKYHVGYPQHPPEYYRDHCEIFFALLNAQLAQYQYLLGEQITIADIAIFPFIRQCALVDETWFKRTPYPNLHRWLTAFLQSKTFLSVMRK